MALRTKDNMPELQFLSIFEQKNEHLLNSMIVDLDNCNFNDVSETAERKCHILKAWDKLIKKDELWDMLLSYKFDDEELKIEFKKYSQDHVRSCFTFGIGCFLIFVQANFTGPDLSSDLMEYLLDPKFDSYDFDEMLAIGNEDINENVKYPCLLVAARSVFRNCCFNNTLNVWWKWRYLMIHQLILDELSPTLLNVAEQMQKEIEGLEIAGYLRALFEIELAQLFLIYRNFPKADLHLKVAAEILGLEYETAEDTLIYETEDCPMPLQLELQERENIGRPPVKKLNVPNDFNVDDDKPLNDIKFVDGMVVPNLPNTEQKLLVAVIHKMIISKSSEELSYVEIKPFIDAVLSQNNTWPVRVAVFLMRNKLLTKGDFISDGSLLQIKEILECIKKSDPHPLNRIGGVFATTLQPIWKTEAQLADLMLNVGHVKGALEIFLHLKHWDEIIACYTLLGKKETAAELIQQELSTSTNSNSNKTVKLLCMLGDATDDTACYERAWTLSNKKSHHSQRQWGLFLYEQRQYEECIQHFEKSLSINPLQTKVWQCLGHAALETENWQIAATAYRRYTTLEPDCFEAWKNLAQTYIELGNKRAAHHALIEALRCNSDIWNVWENLLVVSADICHFKDLMRAYHRLLDMEGDYLNPEVLSVLVCGVSKNVNDHEGRQCGMLSQKTRVLLGRVVALYPSEGSLWELYANMCPIMNVRAQRLQRAFGAYTTEKNWEKIPEKCQKILYCLQNLAEVTLSDDIDPKDTLVLTVRHLMSSSLATIKRQNHACMKTTMQEVATLLSKVIDKNKLGSLVKGEPPKTADSLSMLSTVVSTA